MNNNRLKWQLKLLRLFCKPEYLEEIEGDLLEQAEKQKSQWLFTLATIKLIRPGLIKNLEGYKRLNSYGMLKNQIVISLRFMMREKVFTALNVVGLSIGIACCLFIYLWLSDELKFNGHLSTGDRVCNVLNAEAQTNGKINTYRHSPFPLKAILDEKYPIIESSAVLSKGNWMAFQQDDDLIEWNGIDATPEVFSLFEISFLQGGISKLIDNPNSLVVSERFAEVYFGKDWKSKSVIGTFMENDLGETLELVGVYKNIPRRSTITFDFAVPFTYILKKRPFLKSWKNNGIRLYVKLKDGVSLDLANHLLQQAINDHRVGGFHTTNEVFLQPYEDMYLHNRYENGKITGGRIDYIRLLSITAILVLVLATINFMNLTIARAAKRFKETGVRKILGASKRNIRTRFQLESLIMTTISTVIAILVVLLLFPQFEAITNKDYDITVFSWETILCVLLFIFLQGIIAGLYPSLFLSSFKSHSLLKTVNSLPHRKGRFGKLLVVFQFVTTLIMIIGSLTVHQQVSYIQHKNIGLDRSNLIRTFSYDMNPVKEYKAFKTDLLNKPGIESVTMVDQLLIDVRNATSGISWDGKKDTDELEFRYMQANPDFIPTMKINIKEGRNFNWDLQSDTNSYIINEAAQELMGLKEPIGKKLAFSHHKGPIVGVVKDFHNASLHTAIKPLIIRNRMKDSWMILARSKPGMQKEAVLSLEEVFRTYNNPDREFWFRFLDDIYNAKYRSELLVKKLSLYFTSVSIAISLLGLISLVTYNAEQRAKEVGIRKVLGASITNILRLLSINYIGLLLVAMIVAFPISYFIMSSWLEGFAYRINQDWKVFTLAGLSILILVVLIIGLHTRKVATSNPVDALKDE